MNKVVQLVNEWDAFEKNHPNADIEDFCRHYLVSGQDGNTMAAHCAEDRINLLIIIQRLMSATDLYLKSAMRKTDLPFPEAFFFLYTLDKQGEMKKTELINAMMAEYATGMENISRLLKAGLIEERNDENDKRAKMLSLTDKGKMLLSGCYCYSEKIGELIFGQMDPESLKLCILYLSEIEARHSEIAMKNKNTDFDELFQDCNARFQQR